MRQRTTLGAARTLRISQPAVSNAIKQMETQVGFALFQRLGNRLVPTSEAEEIFDDSEAIFSLYRVFSQKIRALERTESGEIRIMATPPFTSALLPMALKTFLVDRPGVRISLETKDVSSVIEGLQTRTADIGFALAPPIMDELVIETLGVGQMVCTFAPGHPFSNHLSVSARDLLKHPVIAYEPASRFSLLLEEYFLTPEHQYNIVAEVAYSSVACVLAEAGIGVAIVDSLTAIGRQRYDLDFRPLTPSVTVKAATLYTRHEPLKRLVKAFLVEVKKAAANDGNGFF